MQIAIQSALIPFKAEFLMAVRSFHWAEIEQLHTLYFSSLHSVAANNSIRLTATYPAASFDLRLILKIFFMVEMSQWGKYYIFVRKRLYFN